MFTKILLIYSTINLGDVSHAKAVYDALSKQADNKLTKYEIEANSDAETLASSFTSTVEKINEPYVIFAVGEKGGEALDTLINKKSVKLNKAYVGLGIHQYFDVISELPLDYIAIPGPLNKELKVAKQTLLFAVPSSNPSIETLKDDYERWDTPNKPALGGKYIIVILPGDAPDNKGIRYFDKESATKLFKDINFLWKNYPDHKVIVENGPRTGKYKPGTSDIACNHEYEVGKDPFIAVDVISAYFVELLKNNEVPHQFFNFAFVVSEGNKKPISVFNQLLYLAQSNGENFFIIPGESVSMLGQIPLYMFSQKAIVFKPSSMNSDHEVIFQKAFLQNFASYFDDNGKVIFPEQNIKRAMDDSALIAHDLIEGYINTMGEVDLGTADFQ